MGIPQSRWMVDVMENPMKIPGWWLGVALWPREAPNSNTLLENIHLKHLKQSMVQGIQEKAFHGVIHGYSWLVMDVYDMFPSICVGFMWICHMIIMI